MQENIVSDEGSWIIVSKGILPVVLHYIWTCLKHWYLHEYLQETNRWVLDSVRPFTFHWVEPISLAPYNLDTVILLFWRMICLITLAIHTWYVSSPWWSPQGIIIRNTLHTSMSFHPNPDPATVKLFSWLGSIAVVTGDLSSVFQSAPYISISTTHYSTQINKYAFYNCLFCLDIFMIWSNHFIVLLRDSIQLEVGPPFPSVFFNSENGHLPGFQK